MLYQGHISLKLKNARMPACPDPQTKIAESSSPGLHSNIDRVSQPQGDNTGVDSSINLCVLENLLIKYINFWMIFF